MNIGRRNYICMVVMILLLIATSCTGAAGPFPPQTGMSTVQTEPPWFFNPYLSNTGILVVDYQTQRLEAAYLERQDVCSVQHPPVSEEELLARAGGLFDAVGKWWPRRVVQGSSGPEERLDFDITYVDHLAVLEMEPGDFGGVAVSDRCTGLVLFAGEIVWAGRGRQLYPAEGFGLSVLQHVSGQAPAPEQFDVMIGPYAYADPQSADLAWASVSDLNFVQQFATAPYTVLAYLYPRTVGVFNPKFADWIIFLRREPTGSPAPALNAVPTEPPPPLEFSPIPTMPGPQSPLPTPKP